MKYKILILLITLVLMGTISFANDNEYYADKLSEIGVLEGGNQGDFELERKPSKIEGLVILLKLMGAEINFDYQNSTEFKDVDSWAKPWIYYAYENDFINDKDIKTLDKESMDAKTYLCLMLKNLGYEKNEDFSNDNVLEYARSLGIISYGDYYKFLNNDFLRDDLVKISYNVLKLRMKNDDKTLIESLVARDVYSEDVLETIDLSVKDNISIDTQNNINKLSDFWNDEQWIYYNNSAYNNQFYRKNKYTGKEELIFPHSVNEAFIYNGKLYTFGNQYNVTTKDGRTFSYQQLVKSNSDGSDAEVLQDTMYRLEYLYKGKCYLQYFGNIQIYNVKSNTMDKPIDLDDRYSTYVTFTTDGESIFYINSDHNLCQLYLESMERKKLASNIHSYYLKYQDNKVYHVETIDNIDDEDRKKLKEEYNIIGRVTDKYSYIYSFDINTGKDILVFDGTYPNNQIEQISSFEILDDRIIYGGRVRAATFDRLYYYDFETEKSIKLDGDYKYMISSNGLICLYDRVEEEDFLELSEDGNLVNTYMIGEYHVKNILQSDDQYVYFRPCNQLDSIYRYDKLTDDIKLFYEDTVLKSLQDPLYVFQNRYIFGIHSPNLYDTLFYNFDIDASFGYQYSAERYDSTFFYKLKNGKLYYSKLFIGEGLHILDLESKNEMEVVKYGNVFSFDVVGDTILYYSSPGFGGTLYRYDIDVGSVKKTFENFEYCTIFANDFDFYVNIEDSISRYNLETDEFEEIIRGEDLSCIDVTNDRIYFTSNGWIQSYNLKSKEIIKISDLTVNRYKIIDDKLYVGIDPIRYYNENEGNFINFSTKFY